MMYDRDLVQYFRSLAIQCCLGWKGANIFVVMMANTRRPPHKATVVARTSLAHGWEIALMTMMISLSPMRALRRWSHPPTNLFITCIPSIITNYLLRNIMILY